MSRALRSAAVGALVGLSALVLLAVPSHGQQQSLGELAEQRGKYFGNAIDNPELDDSAYADLTATEFGQLTPGNAMKWDATEPQQGEFDFARADEIVDFAEQSDQEVRGHTMVWHNQTPSWVQSLGAEEMRSALRNHVTTVAEHFAGRVRTWDVVNEPLNEDGTMRQSFWYNTLGEDYIAEAFRAARAADPNAKLYINDYNTDGMGPKSDGMYELVSNLLDQGVPIDGVGFQAHLAIQYGFPTEMRQNLQRFADLGLDVAVTELDVRMELPANDSKLATQATYYADVTDACLAVERCVGITVWGASDKYSWVPGTFPGEGAACLYDESFQPKLAYGAVRDALAG